MKGDFNHIDFDKSIGPWLGKTVKMLDYYLQQAFEGANLDLTKEQMVILKKLHEEDGLNQNELALLTYRDKSSLARLLNKMESKNYVLRTQSTHDKRINEVFLTKMGRQVFRQSRPIIQGIIDKMEYGISEKAKEQIIDTLKKVRENFQEVNTLI